LWHAWSRIKILEQFWWGEPKGKIPLRRRKRGCENNTKIKLKEAGWDHVTWIHLAQKWEKLSGCFKHGHKFGSIKFCNFFLLKEQPLASQKILFSLYLGTARPFM
jgi:hypothetical protein